MAEKYFITGVTGLVGGALTKYLADNGEDVTVYVRDREKAEKMFGAEPQISIVTGNLERGISYDSNVDYIIHAAAPTNSSFFVESPVETIDSIVLGTKTILELAKAKRVKSVVNLSSMEMYGSPTNDESLTEDKQFYLDPLNIRSDYPMAKRLAENMCVAYASEYNVPVKIARLAQVLGKKLLASDNRVIAQLIRAAKGGTDIELATDGKTKQTYVGIDDTISGIMTILKKGSNAGAYNLANDSTYCSIRELAEMVASEVASGKIQVLVNALPDSAKYPPNRTLRLNSSKLRALGWQPKMDLSKSLKTLANS
jgi:nucleoside-diphosphate-sugar epimerase